MRARNNNYMISNFASELGEYIQDELHDSQYYASLAMKAPDIETKNILLGFSQDEENHAKGFMREYYRLTGKNYQAKPTELEEIPSLREALPIRIKEEIKAYKTYSAQSFQASNRILADLFASAAASEAEHALLLLLMYNQDQ